jgi:hypothetical protein
VFSGFYKAAEELQMGFLKPQRELQLTFKNPFDISIWL